MNLNEKTNSSFISIELLMLLIDCKIFTPGIHNEPLAVLLFEKREQLLTLKVPKIVVSFDNVVKSVSCILYS
jgi:hypothetical protein